ncbi:MAG: GlsB/YeaQ/YmgE family stress response membrane protein [Acidimicrobiales bacterium]|nr:MAG: GlsB/YeaQ/YmgE family stress response membrane protein [Acidimicrobiales bacterium]
MLILAILGFGILVGALAQFILGRDGGSIDWTIGLVAGLGGSFVGGLLFSLISGDGLALKPSGLIGSIVGAVIITAVWRWYAHKKQSEAKASTSTASRSGRHH